MVPRELARPFYVNACPRRDEPGFETVDVNQCLDCDFCGGSLHEFRGTPLWSMLDAEIVHADESSVLCGHPDGSRNLPTEKQKSFVCNLARSALQQEGGLTSSLPNGWEKDLAFCSAFISAHPDCNICHRKMELRRNRGNNQVFWGCGDYPICSGTSSYSPKSALNEIVILHERERSEEQRLAEKTASDRAK